MKHRVSAESIAAVLILIITFICNIYIWKDNDITGRYDWSSAAELPEDREPVSFSTVSQRFISDRDKLIAVELLFGNVPADSEESLTLMILHEDSVIYQSAVPLKETGNDSWYQLFTNISVAEGEEYQLILSAEADGTDLAQIYLVEEGTAAPENTVCTVDGVEQQSTLLIRYGYLQSYSRKDKLIRSLMTVLIALIVMALFVRRQRILTGVQSYLVLQDSRLDESAEIILCVGIEVLLCCLLGECADLDLQAPVKIALYAFSLLAGLKWRENITYLKSETTTAASRVSVAIAAALAAFMMVGNRTLLYPLDKEVSPIDLLIILAAAIWFVPVIAMFLHWYNRIPLFRSGSMSRGKFIASSVVLLLAASALALYAFNPGITSYDTVVTMAEYAHNIYGMENWHPPFYVMLLRIIITVWDSTYAVILVQFAFWAFVMTEALLLLADRGWDQRFLLLLAFLLGISPANYLHVCSIWKDVPYALTLLWLTILMAKFVLSPENGRKWGAYVEFVIALVLTFFLRQNGMVVYVLAIFAVGLVLRKDRRLLTSLAVSLGLILFIRFPVYSYYDVQETSDTNNGGMYIGLGQDIMGVYYSGGSLSDDSMEIVRVLSSDDMGHYSYNPYRAESSYDLDISITDFIKNYVQTFVNNPVIMTREILLRQDCVWDLFGGEDCEVSVINYYDTANSTDTSIYNNSGAKWLEYYPARNTNAWTYTLIEAQDYTVDNQLLYVLFWSSGIYTLFVLLAFLSIHLKKGLKRNWLIFLPFVSQIVSLILTTGWNDFRYYWPLNLMAVFILMLVPTIRGTQKDPGTANFPENEFSASR